MKKLLISLIALAVSQTALSVDNTVFSCFSTTGKHLAITRNGNFYEYSFGKAGKPELVFKNTRKEVFDRSPLFQFKGEYKSVEMVMKNGKYHYTVYVVMNDSIDIVSSGVTVYDPNGKDIADVQCSKQREILMNWDFDQ